MEVPSHLALAALAAAGQAWADWPTVALDARVFYDPARSEDTRWHVGSNPRIVERLGQHDQFRRWWERAARQCRHLFAPGCALAGHISIFCRSGVHRSVACAVLLQSALQRLGCTVEVQHLAAGEWRRRGNCMGGCRECATSVDGTTAARHVLEIWAQNAR